MRTGRLACFGLRRTSVEKPAPRTLTLSVARRGPSGERPSGCRTDSARRSAARDEPSSLSKQRCFDLLEASDQGTDHQDGSDRRCVDPVSEQPGQDRRADQRQHNGDPEPADQDEEAERAVLRQKGILAEPGEPGLASSNVLRMPPASPEQPPSSPRASTSTPRPRRRGTAR